MNFELKMMIIYTIVFVVIGLFVWFFITSKNKKDKDNISKDYDLATDDDDDPEDDVLSNYDDYNEYITLPTRSGNSTDFDSIDDFLNNFSYREDNYDVVEEDEAKEEYDDYLESVNTIKMATKSSEVINVLIGEKAYIFLANGNKLDNGTKIILKIDDKNYNGVVVRTNYERDLTSLTTLPRDLEVVKIVK